MKILVPVDGSEPALDAVRHALRLRREGLATTFLLATVQEPVYLYERVLPPDAEVLERVTGAWATVRWKLPRHCSRQPASLSSARSARANRPPSWSTWPSAMAAMPACWAPAAWVSYAPR